MPKEKNYNPAQEFHKKRKKEQIKKTKAEKKKLRDEKLAKRDPDKIEAQICELRMLETKGQLSALDRRNLEILESDLKKVKKIRKHMGPIIVSEKTKIRDAREERQQQKIPKHPKKSIYYDPVFNPYGVPPPGMPYKEWSDIESQSSSEGPSTPESIAAIPMPSGSPPPSAYLDKKKHRPKYFKHLKYKNNPPNVSRISQPPEKRFKTNDSVKQETTHPPPVSKIVYSADSILRNLKKESITFIPNVLQRKATSSKHTQPHSKKNTSENIFRYKPTVSINPAPDVPHS